MQYPVVQSARDGGQAPGWSGARSSTGCRADCSDLMHHVLFKGHRLFPGSGVELTVSGWWIAAVIPFVGASLARSKEEDEVIYKGGIDSHIQRRHR